MDERLHGLLARFPDADHLLAASRNLRRRGLTRLDAYSPHPVEGLDQALGLSERRVPVTALVCAVVAGAGALAPTAQDELHHRLGESSQQRAGQEDEDGGLEHRLAAVDVADLPVEWRADRRAEQVGGDNPRIVVEPAELAHDCGQCGGDDGLVKRGEQQPRHQTAEDDEDLPVTQWPRRRGDAGRRSRWCGGALDGATHDDRMNATGFFSISSA